MSKFFQIGDAAPWFNLPASTGKRFHFDTAAGRYLVLCFFGSASLPRSQAILHDFIHPLRAYFDDQLCSFFGVSTDRQDESLPRVKAMMPGIRYFWDFDSAVSTQYGAIVSGNDEFQGFTLLLDPMLRVVATVNHKDPARHRDMVRTALDFIKAGKFDHPTHAPVLILPRVFESNFCRELIGLYETHGGTDSGFMRQVGEKTIAVVNHDFKQRADFSFNEQAEFEPLRQRIRQMLTRRLLPQIKKSFQFEVSHIERYVVACYEAGRGHFRPHRDNTTSATAHRRFACTLNLNADEYEGGDLRFPEFGDRLYRAPTGGAAVFSCSLLHEATPVTAGKRYAFLPFFYNSTDADLRKTTQQFLE